MDAIKTDQRLKVAPLFRRNLRPQKHTPNLISKLPPELRIKIYDFAIEDCLQVHTKAGRSRTTKYGVWCEPPMLKLSKQIRSEAAPIFYKALPFVIPDGLNSKVLPQYLDKIRTVIDICGPKPFKEVTIHIRAGVWTNLSEILHLLELIRSTGFEPATQGYVPDTGGPPNPFGPSARPMTSSSSVFVMRSDDQAPSQKILEQAVAMGRRARDEQWNEQKLAEQFAKWKKKALSCRGRESTRKRKKT